MEVTMEDNTEKSDGKVFFSAEKGEMVDEGFRVSANIFAIVAAYGSINKDRILHQKNVASNITSILNDFGLESYCMGGAPRDWFFGMEARDIDIYVPFDKQAIENLGLEYDEGGLISDAQIRSYKRVFEIACCSNEVIIDYVNNSKKTDNPLGFKGFSIKAAEVGDPSYGESGAYVVATYSVNAFGCIINFILYDRNVEPDHVAVCDKFSCNLSKFIFSNGGICVAFGRLRGTWDDFDMSVVFDNRTSIKYIRKIMLKFHMFSFKYVYDDGMIL